jgi:hypothetical protein
MYSYIRQLLKVKNYEITKLHTNSWRDTHRWSRVELQRIRAASAIARDDNHNERSADNYTSTSGAGLAGCADRAVPRSAPGADSRCFDLSTGSNSASTVDEQQQEFARQSAGGCSGQTTVGSERSVIGRISRRRTADGWQHSMDDRFGKRVPGTANRRNGCSATNAREGAGYRKSKNQRPIGSENRDSLQRQAGNRNSASEPGCCLCALLRSDCGVRPCSC